MNSKRNGPVRETTVINMAHSQGKSRASPWVRLHRASIHSPKIVTLSDRQHRAWHNCLIMADDSGRLPSFRDMAVHMRMSQTDVEQLMSELMEAQLVDPDGSGGLVLHDWDEHQFRSDSSAERTRKWRAKRHRDGDVTVSDEKRNVTVTPPDFRLQTSESEEEESKPSLPEQEATREEVKIPKSDFGRGRRKGEVKAGLRKLAEGLAFPVDDMVRKSAEAQHPNAYFAELFKNEIRTRFPQAPPAFADAVVAGEQTALQAIYQAILEV